MERVICILIGYICGLFQTSYLYGKLHHIDIREYGSGNAGTTNAMRILGKKAGIITFLVDCLKAVLAALIPYYLRKPQMWEVLQKLVSYNKFSAVFPCQKVAAAKLLLPLKFHLILPESSHYWKTKCR